MSWVRSWTTTTNRLATVLICVKYLMILPPKDRKPHRQRQKNFLDSDKFGSEHTLAFNKSIRPLEPGEIDPDDSSPDIDTGMIAAIATKKTDGSNGNAL